ncbi:MAG: SpoIIE family protein phosphatase, partial [Phycisphaerae bacterium]|nr:SpoIIE family protein phosphatase [Phycisphaerae bacterium]
MRIIVTRNQETIAELTFEDEDVIIGSEPGCAVCLEGEGIGPRIAQISLDGDGQWRINKLDDSSLILLNDRPIDDRRTLMHDDMLALGDYELSILLHDPAEAAATSAAEESQLSTEELAKIKQFPLPPSAIVKRHHDPLHLSPDQLDHVARLTVSLVTSRDVHELLDAALAMLLDAFNARMVWIGVRRQTAGELEVVAGRLPSGPVTTGSPVLDQLQYRCLERSQYICVRKMAEGEIGSAMAVPLMTQKGSVGLIYIDRRRDSKRFQIPDLDTLAALAGHISVMLEAVFAERQQRSADQSVAEIDLVHTIQTLLDPRGGPAWKNMQLAAYSRSGQDNPGDVYDIMVHPDNNMSAVMMGHVNAKGASLALSMARLHSTFRVGYLHLDPPHALARALNWLMYNEKDPATVDALFLVIDPATGKFRYTRAGRIGGFIMSAKGEPRLVSGADGPSIGRVRHYEYVSKIDQLAPGETLALYT